jgi:hypothetical protein
MSKTLPTTQSTEFGMTTSLSPGDNGERSSIISYTPKQRVFMGLKALTQKVDAASDLNELRPTLLDRLEKIASWEGDLCNADPEDEELEQQYPVPGAIYT